MISSVYLAASVVLLFASLDDVFSLQLSREHHCEKHFRGHSPMTQPSLEHHRRKHPEEISPSPQPNSENKKKDHPSSNIKQVLGLGIGLGLGIPILCGVLYMCYHIYKGVSAQQEIQMVQQTLARGAFVESFPVPSIEEGTVYECRVCLDEFAEGIKLRLLPLCEHRFCVDCIVKAWADALQPAQCPLCRHQYDLAV